MHTIDVEDAAVYEELKRRATKDRRSLKAYVNLVLERHCGMALGPAEEISHAEQDLPNTVADRAARLRELVNTVQPGAVKTARELLQEREGRRGEEGGDQSRDDYPDHTF